MIPVVRPSVPISGLCVTHVLTNLRCTSIALRLSSEDSHGAMFTALVDTVPGTDLPIYCAGGRYVPRNSSPRQVLLESDADQVHIKRADVRLTLPPLLTRCQRKRHGPQGVLATTMDEVRSLDRCICIPRWILKQCFSYYHHIRRGGGGSVLPRLDGAQQPSGNLPPSNPSDSSDSRGISLRIVVPVTPSPFAPVDSFDRSP